jgi:hypothetical protein
LVVHAQLVVVEQELLLLELMVMVTKMELLAKQVLHHLLRVLLSPALVVVAVVQELMAVAQAVVELEMLQM